MSASDPTATGARTATPSLRHALTPIGRLTSFFTIPAPHCERKCAEARFGDLVAALEALTVGAIIETAERQVDLVQCFRFQLEQRELDLILDVDLGAFAFV